MAIVGGNADVAIFRRSPHDDEGRILTEMSVYWRFHVGPNRRFSHMPVNSRPFYFESHPKGARGFRSITLNAGLPLWVPVTIFSAFPFIAWYRGPLRRIMRRRRGSCVGCGYSLIGNTSGVCPECGKTIDARRRRRSASDLPAHRADAAGTDTAPAGANQHDDGLPIRAGHVVVALLGVVSIGLAVWTVASWRRPVGASFALTNSHALVVVASRGSIGLIVLRDSTGNSTQSWATRTLDSWSATRWGFGLLNAHVEHREDDYGPNKWVTHGSSVIVLPAWPVLAAVGVTPMVALARVAWRWRRRRRHP